MHISTKPFCNCKLHDLRKWSKSYSRVWKLPNKNLIVIKTMLSLNCENFLVKNVRKCKTQLGELTYKTIFWPETKWGFTIWGKQTHNNYFVYLLQMLLPKFAASPSDICSIPVRCKRILLNLHLVSHSYIPFKSFNPIKFHW